MQGGRRFPHRRSGWSSISTSTIWVVVDFHIDDWRRSETGAHLPNMATDSTHRLHHTVPSWVGPGYAFHIRIRVAREFRESLTEPSRAKGILTSAAYYHEKRSWYCHLMVIMPDHLHAILCFPPDAKMIIVVGRWKAWQRRTLRIVWQDNFFDHRIRNNREFGFKADYIRQNPVVKGLCANATDWPWVVDAHSLDSRPQ